MVSSLDLTAGKPSSTSITQVANGETVTASVENNNNNSLLSAIQLVYDWARDNGIDKALSNVFTGSINTFNNIIKVLTIQPSILNGDLSLDPNGTGKIRYLDGSSNTEIASKGYVAGVAFAAGNVPSGGTTLTWLEGDGTWTDPRTFTPWTTRAVNFTAVNKGQYSINTGLNVQLPSPTATIHLRVKPAIGQDFTATPSTLVRAGSEQIAEDAASFTMDVNAIYEITSNGTNWDVAITEIGRV
jgi:hypothetical protein